MKYYIQNCMKYYPRVYSTYLDVILHLLTVLGNGIDMSLKGEIYEEDEDDLFIFPSPTPLTNIYPYSGNYSVPLKYLGSTNIQIREAAQHLIDCIELTPNTVKNISLWKTEGIKDLKTLIKSEPIKPEYIFNDKYNLSIFLDKVKKSLKTNPLRDTGESVYNVKFFDVTWTDTPEYVKEEIRQLWSENELGNDNYIYKTKVNRDLFEEYPRIYLWLKHKEVEDDETVIIHYWW